jgi:hypothetical protein
MTEDLRKSFSAILYERTTSPFYGTLLFSWSIYNWKIIYLTFFISENKIKTDKIQYIITNCNDIWLLVYCPLISTIILLTFIPFVTNRAYWLSLIFHKWRIDKKNSVELKQLLTLEQSIELRKQILEQETTFDKLLENKKLEIEQLKIIIDEAKKPSAIEVKNDQSEIEEELKEIVEKIKSNPKDVLEYEKIMKYIQSGYTVKGKDGPDSKLIYLLESYDIIQNTGSGVYAYTTAGKNFLKLMAK